MNSREQKINVHGVDLNYLKVGGGKHAVLMLPGAMGSIWSNFRPQIENLDRNEFTIIAWDPPGYGQSRPPTRKFDEGFLQQDAIYAKNLMCTLGYDNFSTIGWCNGGITSCFLAARYPESVQKMILIGTNSYILPEEITIYRGLKDLDAWTERMMSPLAAIYGENYVRNVWPSWVDAMEEIYEKRNGDICSAFLEKIQCPTLIVHGEGDRLVKESHAAVIRNKIRKSRVYIFEKGYHDPHLRFQAEFNDLATQFLLSPFQDSEP
ncbi:valacyclovir hydrolase [Neodiprion lecontei]|uniref:Valacyclovir hydrolase n=1 Tax=Neodiprion lecontei TaxID=441921 RepID=A0A6J0CDU4_NEOLC|nr:valacyclovir hydrolase [Neodiprion lecontei]